MLVRRSSSVRWILGILWILGGAGLLACRRGEPGAATERPTTDDRASGTADPSPPPTFDEGPDRWAIDGTTVAEDPRLPPELTAALDDATARGPEAIQDRIVVDLNGDETLDAVVLLPAPAVAGAYDLFVVLSEPGGGARVHPVGELVDDPIFAASVLPLVDGPTLVAVAPRLGGCERGPAWTFLRPTGSMLEPVGRIAVDDFDCAVAEATIEFVRDAEGRVEAVELRYGEREESYRWDASLGSFQKD